MIRISKPQMGMARVRPLQDLWRDRAMQHGLSQDRCAELAQHAVHWIITHDVEKAGNVDFVMIATARSDGSFLTAAPIVEAMRIANHEGEGAISAIRREAMAYLQRPGA